MLPYFVRTLTSAQSGLLKTPCCTLRRSGPPAALAGRHHHRTGHRTSAPCLVIQPLQKPSLDGRVTTLCTAWQADTMLYVSTPVCGLMHHRVYKSTASSLGLLRLSHLAAVDSVQSRGSKVLRIQFHRVQLAPASATAEQPATL